MTNKKIILIGSLVGSALAAGALFAGAQVSTVPAADSTTLVPSANGGDLIQVIPAPVAQSSFTLSEDQVNEEIQRYTRSIDIDEQKLAADQAELAKYQGYLSQFPASP